MMNEDKKRYANLILEGKLPIESAALVWQGVSKKTLQNKVSILGKDEGINTYIRESKERLERQIDAKITNAIAKEKVGLILTSAKKREVLAKIVSGKFFTERQIVVGGKIKKIKVKPELNDILKAIDLDNKMSGDQVQAKPNQVAKAQEVEKVIIMDDQSETIKKVDE